MSRYKKKQKPCVSPQTVEEAEAVAKATQKPSQTKEQTKLIAQGIQKGINEYKKRQKGKARELDKKLKKVDQQSQDDEHRSVEIDENNSKIPLLPWGLLIISWIAFITYITLTQV